MERFCSGCSSRIVGLEPLVMVLYLDKKVRVERSKQLERDFSR